MNVKHLGIKLGTILTLGVSALFAHGSTTPTTMGAGSEKDATLERASRIQAIQSVTANTPLYFSRAAQSYGQGINNHSSHYSHSSHRSHSSHYSHRSSY